MLRLFLIGFCFMTILSGLHAQGNSGPAFLLHFSYGPQLPFGDLEARYGQNWSAEIAGEYMLDQNWFFGAHGQFLFGSTVKENVLANLRTSNGLLIGNDRSPANIQLRQRGSYYGLRVGRLIGMSKKNPRSGIRIALGAGLLQHRIRLQGDPARDVPQIEDEYAKGYDRLTNGLALHQFIGYQNIGINNGIHFIAGFEFFEGFTQSRRSFDFDTRQQDLTERLDILVGFRVGVTLPFFLGNAEDVFY
jgi:hypothetical protein